MHNYQIYPKCHPDGRCPSPDGTEVRPLQLCSDWLYSIPNERIHSCGLPVTHFANENTQAALESSTI